MGDDREPGRRFSDELREKLQEDRPYALEDLMGRDRPAGGEEPVTLVRPGGEKDVTFVSSAGPIRFLEGRGGP